jgi:hypothetical protein
MALPMCMTEDGNQATVIISVFEGGQTFTLCDECLAMWTAAMLEALTGVDPAPFLQAISEPDGAEFGGMASAAPSDGPYSGMEDPGALGDETPLEGAPVAGGDGSGPLTPEGKPRGRSRKGSADPGTGIVPPGDDTENVTANAVPSVAR